MSMPRASGSATISFGLISIPIKTHLCCASEDIQFNLIHKTPTGELHRVKYQTTDADTGDHIEKADIVKGYEAEKNVFITFTEEELDALCDGKKDIIELHSFVADSSFEPMAVEKVHFLSPDKSEKSYRLLVNAMRETKRMAVGKLYSRGKDALITLRATSDHLTMFRMFYANEIRKFDYEWSNKTEPTDQEMKLAVKLVKQLSDDDFDIKNYVDEYQQRLMQAIELKKSGKEMRKMPELRIANKPFDMVRMLEESIEKQKVAAIKPKKK